MSLFGCFGIGAKKTAAENNVTEGLVTKVEVCWWLKINTKPVRAHALDGAVFPHIIRFTYTVEGKEYAGSRYVNWNVRCPQKGERIKVYYRAAEPEKYAIECSRTLLPPT